MRPSSGPFCSTPLDPVVGSGTVIFSILEWDINIVDVLVRDLGCVIGSRSS